MFVKIFVLPSSNKHFSGDAQAGQTAAALLGDTIDETVVVCFEYVDQKLRKKTEKIQLLI